MRRLCLLYLFALIVPSMLEPSPAQAQYVFRRYEISRIGDATMHGSALALSESGIVGGHVYTLAGAENEAFLYRPEPHNSLITLGDSVGYYSRLVAVRGTKLFAGWRDEIESFVVDADRKLHVLNPLGNDIRGAVFDVVAPNGSRFLAVGCSATGSCRPTVWNNSVEPTPLRTFPGTIHGYARAINSSLIAVGNITQHQGGNWASNAVAWRGIDREPEVLLADAVNAYASDISENNIVVGAVGGLGESRGFVWKDGVVTVLRTTQNFEARADGVNNLGEVVGSMYYYAVIWSPENEMRLLFDLVDNPGEWVGLETAYQINNSGQIVGYGYVSGSNYPIPYLLTPVN